MKLFQSTRILASLLGFIACAASPEPPNVVLITIDTLRPDHLSSYGYRGPTSDALDRLLEGAVVFENAYSTSSWTAPAVASLITSLSPHRHRIRHGDALGFPQGKPVVVFQEVLSEAFVTLAELLDRRGYATYAFSTNPHVSEELGFARGFDHFESLGAEAPDAEAGIVYADARVTGREVSRRVGEIRGSEPFLLWIHYLDPHHPYHRRCPPAAACEPGPDGAGELPPVVLNPHLFEPPGLDLRAKRRILVTLYDSEIRFVIEEVAALLEKLDLADDTLYVITSDHGESFYEHGQIGHGQSLQEAELRIPLLMKFPAGLPYRGRESRPVSILDVMPTILDVAGVASPADTDGRSLLPLLRGEDRDPDRVLYSELLRHGRNLRSIRRGDWKYVADLDAGREQLFHLAEDPRENRNLVRMRPDVRAQMKGLLAERLEEDKKAARAAPPRRPLDPETVEKLRALGYVD